MGPVEKAQKRTLMGRPVPPVRFRQVELMLQRLPHGGDLGGIIDDRWAAGRSRSMRSWCAGSRSGLCAGPRGAAPWAWCAVRRRRIVAASTVAFCFQIWTEVPTGTSARQSQGRSCRRHARRPLHTARPGQQHGEPAHHGHAGVVPVLKMRPIAQRPVKSAAGHTGAAQLVPERLLIVCRHPPPRATTLPPARPYRPASASVGP